MSLVLYSYPNVTGANWSAPAYYHTVRNMNAKISIGVLNFVNSLEGGQILISFDNAQNWMFYSTYDFAPSVQMPDGHTMCTFYASLYYYQGITNIAARATTATLRTLQVSEYFYPGNQ